MEGANPEYSSKTQRNYMKINQDLIDRILHIINKRNCIDSLKWDEWRMCGYRMDHYMVDIQDVQQYCALLSQNRESILLPHFNRVGVFPVYTFQKGELFCLVYKKTELIEELLKTF